jgi:hypothetical protein
MAKHPKTKTAKGAGRGVSGLHRLIPSNKPEYVVGHRESKRNAGMVPAEIWLPKAWRDAVIASGETLQDTAQKAFQLLITHWDSNQAS